jgi:SNF2 family DNA or RNA helicase
VRTLRPFELLHPYQVDGIDFLLADLARQFIAIMGAGKTAVALHAIAALKLIDQLDGVVIVVAPLMIAETVWTSEARQWEQTAGLIIERVIGTPKQRSAALDRPADVYVTNYDNLAWFMAEACKRGIKIAVLIADEASALKSSDSVRTRLMIKLAQQATRRWALTGTPRTYQLTDVWGPAQFVTRATAFPPFPTWRNANFYPVDQYARIWRPRSGVEAATTERLRPFTKVVDRAALATRPLVVEIIHNIPLPEEVEEVYRQYDEGTTEDLEKLVAAGLTPASDIAIVGKLQQVLSGAVYGADGGWTQLHDRRLDKLVEIHEGHDRPTLVFVTFRHEIERIQERFPFAQELHADLIEAWNRGEIEMLIAHPASAGHGVNLQHGSDVAVWLSLPWSAELFAQANARLARQGQTGTVTIHTLISSGRIDEIALRVVRNRLQAQDELIEALAAE